MFGMPIWNEFCQLNADLVDINDVFFKAVARDNVVNDRLMSLRIALNTWNAFVIFLILRSSHDILAIENATKVEHFAWLKSGRTINATKPFVEEIRILPCFAIKAKKTRRNTCSPQPFVDGAMIPEFAQQRRGTNGFNIAKRK
jgi:hypothetical protein